MKFTLYLFTLSLLLTSCSKSPSDSQIRHKLVGTWRVNSGVLTVYPNGELKIVRGTNVIDAHWRVEGGFLIQTPIAIDGSDPSEAYAHDERYKIVRINGHELVCQVDGRTNLLTASKQ